jgi:hypothetical protein
MSPSAMEIESSHYSPLNGTPFGSERRMRLQFLGGSMFYGTFSLYSHLAQPCPFSCQSLAPLKDAIVGLKG